MKIRIGIKYAVDIERYGASVSVRVVEYKEKKKKNYVCQRYHAVNKHGRITSLLVLRL